ncbi:MAG: hypothetical protein QM784_37255 [Polyangiaceae bacterium]
MPASITRGGVLGMYLLAALSVACGRSLPQGPPVTPRVIRMLDEVGFRLIAAYDAAPSNRPGLLVANDVKELDTIWQTYQLAGPLPSIEFDRFMVLAYASSYGRHYIYEGALHCLVDRFTLTRDRRLVPSGMLFGSLNFPPHYNPWPYQTMVHVVAFDRRVLPQGELAISTAVKSGDDVSTTERLFVVKPVEPRPSLFAATPKFESPVRKRRFAGSTFSTTSEPQPVPARGNVCLARLSDGGRAWIVHHGNGELSVIAGDFAVQPVHARMPWRFAAPAARGIDFGKQPSTLWNYRLPTVWNKVFRSFNGVFDETGSAIVQVLEPLDHHEFSRVDEAHIVIGDRITSRQRWPVRSIGYWPTEFQSGVSAYWDVSDTWSTPEVAATQAVGTLAPIWGELIAHPDGGVRICPVDASYEPYNLGEFGRTWEASPASTCSVEVPRARDVELLHGPTGGLAGQVGPLVARVAEGGFAQVILLMAEEKWRSHHSQEIFCDHSSRRRDAGDTPGMVRRP